MNISDTHSKNMHLHTEREGAYFPINAINEVSQRYLLQKNIVRIKWCLRLVQELESRVVY